MTAPAYFAHPSAIYPRPMHWQECFRQPGYRAGEVLISEVAANDTLAAPMYPEITPGQQECVGRAVTAWLRGIA
jgi:dTDP-4-amino-4,6-dideoxygalactose transaminase